MFLVPATGGKLKKMYLLVDHELALRTTVWMLQRPSFSRLVCIMLKGANFSYCEIR